MADKPVTRDVIRSFLDDTKFETKDEASLRAWLSLYQYTVDDVTLTAILSDFGSYQ